MKELSQRTAGFTDSVIRRMTRISNQYGAVNLSQGFPDFQPPQDLLDRLAADPAFGMTRTELDAVMEPKLYIGRCKQQVERFLDECEPLLKDAAAADGQISL